MRYPDPAQCVRLLDCLLRSFGKNGQHWTRFTYDDGNGNRCLIGAVDDIERKHRSLGSGMTGYIVAALWPGQRDYSVRRITKFNDGCRSFQPIRAAIRKARALAQRDAERLPPKIIAAANAAYSAEKEFIAQVRKRQLLAEIERERIAAGTLTYILCPRAPDHPQPEPLRLAA